LHHHHSFTQKTITLKMKKIASILLLASAIFYIGCQKDDYVEIIGVCPVVLTTDPANLETAVPLDQVITVTFNGEMNPTTITTVSLTVQGTIPVAGTVTYGGTTASFTPSANLSPFTSYTGRVTTAVKEVTGNALQTDYVWTFNTGAAGVFLGSTDRFGIIASQGVSNVGFSEIHNMDIGVSPGFRTSITGFPPGIIVNGEMFASNDLFPTGTAAMLQLAKQDLTNAYLFAESATSQSHSNVAGDLGGRTLTPGIYTSTSTMLIQSGNLTLDAKGDPNAYWIFQIPSALTTVGGAGGDVILTGGAKASNIYWQVGSSATIGDGTSFRGNILAFTSITLNSGASVTGRLLARNGAIVLTNTNIINKP
jgi:hypothetical protein